MGVEGRLEPHDPEILSCSPRPLLQTLGPHLEGQDITQTLASRSKDEPPSVPGSLIKPFLNSHFYKLCPGRLPQKNCTQRLAEEVGRGR